MKLHVVPARTGTQWVREGLRLFFKQPLAFAGLFFVFMAFSQLAGYVPLAGEFVSLMLVPAFTVGMMAASRTVEAGRFPMPRLLLTAFRVSPANTRSMLVLGVLYAAAGLLIVGIASLVGDQGKMAELLASKGGQLTPEILKDPAVQDALRANMRMTMLTLVLFLPVSILFWHAPALVNWYQVPIAKSLFFSAVGVLRNTGAYVVFFMGLLMIGMLALLVLMMVAGMLGNPNIALGAMVPVSLAISTIMLASLWATFRDTFDVSDMPAEGSAGA